MEVEQKLALKETLQTEIQIQTINTLRQHEEIHQHHHVPCQMT